MNYYALLYYLKDDYMERRPLYRHNHLQLAQEAHQRGELILAGAFSDPADRALLIFRVEDKAIVEQFVQHDPYVLNGLIARWEIRPWTLAIGPDF
jgi:uncharacterized protein YciI